MTKIKSTKRALLAAVLALVVSISMLIGTTFAWFTDSVTSANNKIVSGNLIVDLEMYDKATDTWSSVKENHDPIFTYSNWEPGYVDAKLLKVQNEGSLALKWKAAFVSATPLGILADVIDVFVKPGVTEAEYEALTRADLSGWENAGTVREFLGGIEASTYGTLEAGKEATLGIALKMRESAGNEYMDQIIEAFDIKILATQLASEDDSFDENYDIFADYDGEISNAATLEAAFNQGGTFKVTDDFNVDTAIELGDNDVALDLNGKSITATSDDGYVIMNENGGNLVIGDSSVSTPYSMRRTAGSVITGVVYTGEGSTTTVNGGTYNAAEGGAYVFLNSSGTLIINNATIIGGTSYPIYSYGAGHKLVINDATVSGDFGSVGSYGEGTIEINGGSFTANGSKGKTHHCVYVGSATDLVINDGIFAHNGAGISDSGATITVYAGANGGATINGGTFTGSGTYIAPFDKYDANCYLVINGGTFSKDPSKYVADGFKAVEINGAYSIIPADYEKTAYAGLYKKDKTFYVYTAAGFEGLNKMFADKSAGKDAHVKLMADIDMTGKTWTPVDSHADSAFEIEEFDGQGYTISNLTINGQAMFTRFAGLGDVTFKNVTFDNAKVNSNGSINTAIITGHTYQNVLLDNVDVKNSTIIGGYKVAPFIGTVYNESTSTITATLKNCDVSDTVVKATSYDFSTTGMVAFVKESDNDRVAFENCTVTNVELYAPNVYTAHAAVYTAGSETLFNEVDGVTVTNVTFENI